MKKHYLIFFLAILSPISSYPDPISSSSSSPFPFPFSSSSKKTIFDSWQGTHTSDFWYGVRGGLEKRMGYLNLTDLRFNLNFDNVFPTKDVTGLIEVQALTSNWPNFRVNSFQGFDNIEEDRVRSMAYLYQLWLLKKFGSHWSLGGGFYDLNSEFYVTPSTLNLILPTWGVGSDLGNTGPNFPSVYPLIGMGFRLKYTPDNKLYMQTALFDASSANFTNRIYAYAPFSQAQGVFGIVEVGRLLLDKKNKEAQGKLALGVWKYSTEDDGFSRPDNPVINRGIHDKGMYGMIDYPIYINTSNKDNIVHGFVRYGVTEPAADIFQKALGMGVTINGFSKKRPQDIISLGIAPAWTSHYARKALNELPLYEFQAEITYVATLKKWFVLQPDLVWISFPKGDPELHPEAFLIGLRLTLNLDQLPRPGGAAAQVPEEKLHRKHVRNPIGRSVKQYHSVGLSPSKSR